MNHRQYLFAIAVLVAVADAMPVTPSFADPDALAKIVEGKCVPDEQTSNNPAPCKLVDLKGRYAVLKDLVGKSQYLLIPTDKVAGIESPDIEKSDAPNYFEDAWEARTFVSQSLGRDMPRDDIGLAINSEKGRTQNQLHIHVDCMQPDVVRTLAADAAAIGQNWAPLPGPLAGHPYQAMKLESADLTGINPFALLQNGVPAAGADMGDETLILVGATFSDGKAGFYLLSDRVGAAPGDLASSEELEDHDCAVAK